MLVEEPNPYALVRCLSSFVRTKASKNYESVDPVGVEPTTSSMPLRRASQLRYGPIVGPEGIRTLDLLSAIEARSQLRYRPI